MRALRTGLLGATLGVATLVSTAPAEVFDGGGGTTDFNTAANWENDNIPGTGGGEFAIIGQVGDNGGIPFQNPAVVELNADPAIPDGNNQGDLRVGNGANGDGTFNHSGGTINTGGSWSFIAADGTGAEPAVGTYNMSGSATFTHAGAEFHIGVGGGARGPGDSPNDGLLTVADNAQFLGDAVYVGSNDGNVGAVTQTGGAVSADRWISIGREGGAQGTYNMSGGTLTVNQDGVSVGESSGASGTFNLSGTANANTNALRVGRNDTSTGLLTITGNGVTLNASTLEVGANAPGVTTTANGTLSFDSDGTGGVSPIVASGDVTLNDGSVAGSSSLIASIDASVVGDVLLIDVGGTLSGAFAGLPEGTVVPGSGGRTITYAFGDGNDVALISVIPEPTALALLALGIGAGAIRRRG